MQVDHQTAFLIHSRKYTDSRLIVELFTQHYGRVSAVLRQNQRSKKQSLVQPFQALSVSWYGKSELKTIRTIEQVQPSFFLQNKNLYCGLYLNELMQRGLPPEDANEPLFDAYVAALSRLSKLDFTKDAKVVETTLREFEFDMLRDVGFEIDFEHDSEGRAISSEFDYYFSPHHGFSLYVGADSAEYKVSLKIFPGEVVIKLGTRDFDEVSLPFAKKIVREALPTVIGDRPLQSRELFR